MRSPLILLLAVYPALAATLVDKGTTGFSICLDPGAIPAEKRAAAELQRFIQEMSGAQLPIDSSCTAKHAYVFVGPSPALNKVLPSSAILGNEEFILKTIGGHLIITGGRPRGTLYGVYTLLDRLGCRWFTSEVSRIPKQSTIRLPDLDVREKPAFEYREVFFTEAFDRDWAARNRLNSSHSKLDESTGGRVEYYPFVHSFYELVPPEKYFREHPEYFSWIDGARRPERAQLCLTNPDVLRISVERVREWIQKNPKATILSVSQNDYEGWCECDRCQRVEMEEGGTHSGPVLRFVNAVAAEIAKTNPDKLIDTLAYWYTEDPPAHVRPLPNVRIRLCPIGVCEAHPYTQCPRSAYFARNLKAWNAITNQLYIWHYNTNFRHYLTPFPDFDELAADIPLYKRNGVVGLFLQGGYAPGGGAENAELRSYVMARQLWNPGTDVNREVDAFLQGVYGPAASAMRRYHDRLHKEVRMPPAGSGQHIWIFNLPDFSRTFLDEAKAMLSQALKAATDPAIHRRVERAALPVEYVELVQAGEYRVNGDTYAPTDLATWKDRFQTFTAKLKTFGIQSIREGVSLDDQTKAAVAMQSYRIVQLENERWRVTIVPEMSGRILQMISKNSGLDLLRIPKAGEAGYPQVGGQTLVASADFPLRPWEAQWRLGEPTSSHSAVLEGVSENGVKLERRIWLEGDWVRTRGSARNQSAQPLDVVLLARAEFEPGDLDAVRVQYRSIAGTAVDRGVLNAGEIPNGTETLRDQALPAGEWSLQRQSLSPVVNRFSTNLSGRATLTWTPKGGSRAGLGVWSKRQRLEPGQALDVEADYR